MHTFHTLYIHLLLWRHSDQVEDVFQPFLQVVIVGYKKL